MSDAPNAGPGGSEGVTGGPKTPQQVAAQRRLQQTQAQVDEVVGIMRTNVEKVLERDQKLSELDDRADALQQGASQFEQQAGKLKRKFWLKNLKMMIIMGIIGLIVIIIIGDYYASQWLVTNECLQELFGFRWCFSPSSTNQTLLVRDATPATSFSTAASLPTSTSTVGKRNTDTTATTKSILPTFISTITSAYGITTATTSIPEITTPSVPKTSTPAATSTIFSSLTPQDSYFSATTMTLISTFQTTPEPQIYSSIATTLSATSHMEPNKQPPVRMLKRQHDVLDPANIVEPVLSDDGRQVYGLHEVPLFKNVNDQTYLVS